MPKDCHVADTGRPGLVNRDQAALTQVRDKDPDNAGRQAKVGRELNQGCRYLATGKHSGLLGSQPQVQAGHPDGTHHVNKVNALAGRTGHATGQPIGPDDGAGIAVNPLAATVVHCSSPFYPVAVGRCATPMWSPTRRTSKVIS